VKDKEKGLCSFDFRGKYLVKTKLCILRNKKEN